MKINFKRKETGFNDNRVYVIEEMLSDNSIRKLDVIEGVAGAESFVRKLKDTENVMVNVFDRGNKKEVISVSLYNCGNSIIDNIQYVCLESEHYCREHMEHSNNDKEYFSFLKEYNKMWEMYYYYEFAKKNVKVEM